jgi:membrane protease YdiL (CAAX protease family)
MRKQLDRLISSHPFLTVLLTSVLFTGVLGGAFVLFDYIPGKQNEGYSLAPVFLALFTLIQMTLSVAIIWLMRKMRVFNVNDFKFKNIGKGFLLGWFGILLSISNLLGMFAMLPKDSIIIPGSITLFITILYPFLGTALYEEVLFRGLMLKVFLLTMGHSKKGIMNACLISSAIFGFSHIINIVSGGDILPVATQMISAFFGGMFYAALFIRTKTLWVPILLHGFNNLPHSIFSAVMRVQPNVDTGGGVIGVLIVSLPFLIAGLIMLKKVTTDDVDILMNG